MRTAQYQVKNEECIFTPALIYYKELIEENTRETIRIAGGTERLWPHVKSHKMKEMLKMQIDMGITRFKCATLPEVRMTAECGAKHILLAYPLIGPGIAAYTALTKEFPDTAFYALADNLEQLRLLDAETQKQNASLGFFVDVNMGMNRTGVETEKLYDFLTAAKDLQTLTFSGLHCYDGHVHTTDLSARRTEVSSMVEAISEQVDKLSASGITVPVIIAGGSPSFPCHAANPKVFLSPGTVFLWDAGYAESYPDLPYIPAAAVMTRVVSHPTDGMFTLDLGCKGIATDPAGSRGTVIGLQNAEVAFQSEEHWTYRMLPGFENDRPAIGTVFYVIPTHICPTTNLYSEALIAEKGEITAHWTVDARR